MRILSEPYRRNPPEARCFYQHDETRLLRLPHQQNLFLRHYAAESNDLLSVVLVCRTLAMAGDWHRRINADFLNITFVHSGETEMRIGEQSFVAEAGDLVLLPPNEDYEFGTSRRSVRSGILVQGSIVDVILRELDGKYVFQAQEIDGIEAVIEDFFQEYDTNEHHLAVKSFDLLSRLKKSNNDQQLPEILQKVIQKMKKQLDRALSVELLAREAGVSARTLTRSFKKHLQISPYRYLVQLRMKRACQMLQCGEFSIKEIAITVGYPNALNFSTEFRNFSGLAPTQYRLQKNSSAVKDEISALPVK